MHRISKSNLIAVFIVIVCIVWIIKSIVVPEVKMIVSNGVVATVGNVHNITDTKWTIEISLSKENGTTFDKNVEVGNIALSSLNKGSFSWEYDVALSTDQKVINYLFTIQSNTHIKGMKIELDNLIVTTQGTELLEKSIYDIYHTHPLKYDYDQEVMEAANDNNIAAKEDGLIPISDIDNFHIIGVGFSNNYDITDGQLKQEVLHIRTKLVTKKNGVSNVAKISGLYNELTKDKITWFQGYTRPDMSPIAKGQEPSEDIEFEENYYELTNTEKLCSIKPILDYTLKQIISDGKWTLNVKF